MGLGYLAKDDSDGNGRCAQRREVFVCVSIVLPSARLFIYLFDALHVLVHVEYCGDLCSLGVTA